MVVESAVKVDRLDWRRTQHCTLNPLLAFPDPGPGFVSAQLEGEVFVVGPAAPIPVRLEVTCGPFCSQPLPLNLSREGDRTLTIHMARPEDAETGNWRLREGMVEIIEEMWDEDDLEYWDEGDGRRR